MVTESGTRDQNEIWQELAWPLLEREAAKRELNHCATQPPIDLGCCGKS